MTCPNCSSRNRNDATFCLECGESLMVGNAPFLLEAVDDAPAALPAGSQPMSEVGWDLLDPRAWRLEVKLLIAVVLAIFAFDYFAQTQSRDEAARYRAGGAAINENRWHAAEESLRPLVGKGYQEADARYKVAKQKVDDFETAYAKADTAQWRKLYWQAAYYLTQAASIEPTYNDVLARRNQSRAAAGGVIYQRSSGPNAGLYHVGLDGSDTKKLPNSSGDSYLHTEFFPVIADENGSILYNVSMGGGFVRQDLTSGDWREIAPLPISGEVSGGYITALPDKRYLLIENYHTNRDRQVDGLPSSEMVFSVYDTANGQRSKPITATSWLNADPAGGSLYYFTAAEANDRITLTPTLHLYDIASGQSVTVRQLQGRISGARVLADPLRLIYITMDEQGDRIQSLNLRDGSSSTLLTLPPSRTESGRRTYGYDYFEPDEARRTALLSRQSGLNVMSFYLLKPGGAAPILWPPSVGEYEWLHCTLNQVGTRILCAIRETETRGRVEMHDLAGKLLLRREVEGNLRYVYFLSDRYLGYTMQVGDDLQTTYYVLDSENDKPAREVARIDRRNRGSPPQLTADGSGLIYLEGDTLFVSGLDGSPRLALANGVSYAWIVRAAPLTQTTPMP